MLGLTLEIPGLLPGVARRVRCRAWPLALTALTVLTGMANCLWLAPELHHGGWAYPGDIWSAYRSAHFVAWGAIGSIYSAGTYLVTFPGMVVALAPLAGLTGALGMSEGFPMHIPHPTAWLVLGPYEMVVGCTALFACDAVAQRLGAAPGRRAVLCVAQAVALWPVLVIWGHPEDALALALALYALLFVLDGRWSGAGWLFGAAVATQPLVLLALPVLMAVTGARRAPGLLTRAFLPAAVLLAGPLVGDFHVTVHALVAQPNYPVIDHVTPWTSLAPKLGGSGRDVAVAAGPGRVVAVLGACVLGWTVRRWRTRPELVVWIAAAALGLRCLTESVMVAFYLWPVLAVGMVAASSLPRRRAALAVVAAVSVTVSSQFGLPGWSWWWVTNAGMLLVLLAGIASRTSGARTSRVDGRLPIPPDAAGAEVVRAPTRMLVRTAR